MTHAWVLVVAISVAGCSSKDEEKAREVASTATDKAKAAAVTARDKAAIAIERAKEAASVAKDKIGETIEIGGEALDRMAQKSGILEELDAAIQRGIEAVKTAATDAARDAAQATLINAIKLRAAIARRIDELKAAGTYRPTPP